MAWLKSHSERENHPKTIDLKNLMSWDLDTTLGKLDRFWWWCQKYAEDGDLRKHNDSRIADSMGVAMADSKRLVDALVKAGWLDREPYFRVHDWWDHIGDWLRAKYKRSPERWGKVKEMYSTRDVQVTQPDKGDKGEERKGDKELTPLPPLAGNGERDDPSGWERLWNCYPNGKDNPKAYGDAMNEYMRLNPDAELLEALLEAVRGQKGSLAWNKDDGRWIPTLGHWLRDKRWLDKLDTVPAVRQEKRYKDHHPPCTKCGDPSHPDCNGLCGVCYGELEEASK
jgi:hypothetical protein